MWKTEDCEESAMTGFTLSHFQTAKVGVLGCGSVDTAGVLVLVVAAVLVAVVLVPIGSRTVAVVQLPVGHHLANTVVLVMWVLGGHHWLVGEMVVALAVKGDANAAHVGCGNRPARGPNGEWLGSSLKPPTRALPLPSSTAQCPSGTPS